MIRYAALIQLGEYNGDDPRFQGSFSVGFPDLPATADGLPAYFEGYPPLKGPTMLTYSDFWVEPIIAAIEGLNEIAMAEGSLPTPNDFASALPPAGCALVAIPLNLFMPFPAFLHSASGEYRIEFVDLPGIVATGATVEKALIGAERAAREFAARTRKSGEPVPVPSNPRSIEVPAGSHLVVVPLYQIDD